MSLDRRPRGFAVILLLYAIGIAMVMGLTLAILNWTPGSAAG
ncbi:hypothetical protein [Teichococcus oryzae]|nr:hypothetical protein [Pseudoroseomonas oryzae]